MLNKFRDRILSGNSRSVIVKKNILASLVIKGCSIILSLVLVPITLDYLSSELYGIWLTLSSVILWLHFFDVGFTLGLKNKLGEAIALENWEKGKSLVSTAYVMMAIIFIPVTIILLFVIPYINWALFLNISTEYNHVIQQTMYLLVVCLGIHMIVFTLNSIIAAFQNVALSSLFPVIGNFISLIIIYILTKYTSSSLPALAFTMSVMPIIVVSIASIYLFKGKYSNIKPSIKYFKSKYIKELFGLGYKFFFIKVQVIILFQLTNILISNVSGPEEVTNYNLAYKYLSVAMMAYTIILNPLWPAFTNAFVKKDFPWMSNIYKKMTNIYYVSLIILIIMVVISPLAYKLWLGNEVEIPTSMTICVALYMIIYTWDSLQINLINGIGAIKLQTIITLFGCIIHIPLAIFLGRYWGALGVVISMIFINLIYSILFTYQIKIIISKKATGIWIE